MKRVLGTLYPFYDRNAYLEIVDQKKDPSKDPKILQTALLYTRLFRLLKRIHFLNGFFVLYFYFSLYLKFKIKNGLTFRGSLKLRWNQTGIVIGNHSSAADFFLMAACAARFGRIVHALISEQDFKRPDFRILFQNLGMIPRAGTGDQIVSRMIRCLNQNQLLALAPEGTFSKGLVMHPFTGFVRVYFDANRDGYRYPIIPFFMKGIAQAYPYRDNYFARFHKPRKAKIELVIGAPFHLKMPQQITKETLRQYADYIMLKVARLGGQRKLYPNPKIDNMHRQGLDRRVYESIDGVD